MNNNNIWVKIVAAILLIALVSASLFSLIYYLLNL